jgi:hypothetical protein
VGSTSTSVGTFSNLVVSINENLTNSGYPGSWTVYTTTLSGVSGTIAGRFGFNYVVPNGGPTGTNSSYIGLDAIGYELPCANPTLAVSSSTNGICTGQLATISATGATTYTWSNGSNSPSITVSPTTTTIYTVTASSIPNCNSTETIVINATVTPVVSVADVTTCPGTAATLMATGATTYSWDNGATTSSIIVTPTMNTTYTVTGYNATCEDVQFVSVAMGVSLSVNASSSQTLVCSGSSLTLFAMGASDYTWTPGNALTQNTIVSPTVSTIYTVSASSGTCTGTHTVSVGVNARPTVSVSSTSSTTICGGVTITLTATGANTYSWSNSALTSSVISILTSTVAGNYAYNVIGTGTNNCSNTASISRTVAACVGIDEQSKNVATISVYPNPFTNELKISGQHGSVEFYNSLGQLVFKQSLNVTESINTTDFAKGIYILKVYGENGKLSGTSKVIKN